VRIDCHGRALTSGTGIDDKGRKPEQSVLYQIVREHLETFLARAADNSDNGGFPAFVVKELRRFLGCQILANGFTRFRG